MNLRSASIIYFQGKFYIPSTIESESGLLIDADPVYVTNIDLNDMVQVVERVLLTPRPRVPDLNRDDWKKRKDPVLQATGAKSWKELARKGSSYNIGWSANQKRLDFSRVDKQGRWVFDPDRAQIYPVNTPLDIMIRNILEDVHSRE